MEFERSAVNSAKTIVRLEVKCDQLQRENINFKEEVMEAKRREEEMKEKMMEKCVKVKDKYKKVKEKFDLEERKWREEEEKIREECRQLEVDKRKLEIDLEAATSSRADGGDDLAKKWKAAEAEVKALVNWLEERDGLILLTQNETLVLTHMIQVLEGEKAQLEAEFREVKEDNRSKDERICVLEKVKEAEIRAMEDEGKKEVSELTCRIGVLERENRELKAKFCQVNTKKSEEINRILNEKMTMEVESKKKGLELVRRIEVLERAKSEEIKRILNEKTIMEAKSEAKVLELVRRIEELEREKRANEAKVCQADKEKSEEISMILNEKMVIEAEKTTMEMKVLELVRSIEALERENREIKAEVCWAKKEKSEDIKRILNEKMVAEAEKTTMEAESKKKVLELVQRIEVLEREKREMEAEVCRVKKEKSEEFSRILNEKMAVEAEKTSMETESKKKVLELVRRIEALEREIEAEVCEAKIKSEKIKRILNEKTPSQEKHEKRILEREKQGLEAETGNNGVIQVLVQQNECSVAKIKRMDMETKRSIGVRSEEDEQLTPQVHLASNFGILGSQSDDVSVAEPNKESSLVDVQVRWHDGHVLGSELSFCGRAPTPTAQDQGSQSDDVSVTEPNKESSIVDVQVRWQDGHVLGSELLFWGRARTRSQKRKIEALECSLANKARTIRCEAHGLTTEHALI